MLEKLKREDDERRVADAKKHDDTYKNWFWIDPKNEIEVNIIL